MMAQYLALKAEARDCLLFYRMGDFFELFFDDAKIASACLDIALTARGEHDGEKVAMCGVPAHSADSYLARLIRAGHRVAIADQIETPEEARKRGGSKALVARAIVRVVTAGTLTEETLLDSRRANWCAAIGEAGGEVALAGDHIGQGAYAVATIELAPPPKSILMFQDGWHQRERDGDREWQWTAGEAIITFRNPRQDSILYFELDGRPDLFESPPRVELVVGDRTIDSFSLEASGVTFHAAMVSASDFGDDDTTELTLHVDQTFVPATLPDSNGVDARRLGVRVFHAFLESR